MKKTYKYLTGLAVLAALTFAFFHGRPTHPTTDKDIAATTAMITRMDGRSGGTGVILTSKAFESTVLTNAHVCGVVKFGGVVTTDRHRAMVTSYKVSNQHDLCLITVSHNLGITTEVADNAPEIYSSAAVSGHPALMNTIVTRGHFSEKTFLPVVVDMKECTKEDLDGPNAELCIFLGALPIIKVFEAQTVTPTIMPGSSGSGIFDSDGRIAGLIFAGQGDIGYGQAVPFEYVKAFVDHEVSTLTPQKPLKESEAGTTQQATKLLKDACKKGTNGQNFNVVKGYCRYIQDLLYTEDEE